MDIELVNQIDGCCAVYINDVKSKYTIWLDINYTTRVMFDGILIGRANHNGDKFDLIKNILISHITNLRIRKLSKI